MARVVSSHPKRIPTANAGMVVVAAAMERASSTMVCLARRRRNAFPTIARTASVAATFATRRVMRAPQRKKGKASTGRVDRSQMGKTPRTNAILANAMVRVLVINRKRLKPMVQCAL
jgi:hypothetical protein